MKKIIIVAAIFGFGLGGCATTANLSPCEKAILAKYAADKIIGAACPLTEHPAEGAPQDHSNLEGVY